MVTNRLTSAAIRAAVAAAYVAARRRAALRAYCNARAAAVANGTPLPTPPRVRPGAITARALRRVAAAWATPPLT